MEQPKQLQAFCTPPQAILQESDFLIKLRSTDATTSPFSPNRERSIKSARGSVKSDNSKGDFYGKSASLIIEETTKTIQSKNAEKKHLENTGSQLRLDLNDAKEEIRKKEKIKEFWKKKIAEETVIVQKKSYEIAALQEMLDNILSKKTEAEEIILLQAEEYFALRQTINNDIKEKKEEIAYLKVEINKEKVKVKSSLTKVSDERFKALSKLEKAQDKVRAAKSVEGERIRIIKEKSQPLKGLLKSESRSTGIFSPKISRILRSPTKSVRPFWP